MAYCMDCNRDEAVCICDDDGQSNSTGPMRSGKTSRAEHRASLAPYAGSKSTSRTKRSMDGLKPQKKKAKSPAPYPTNAGVNINGLRTGVLRTRTGFWNVQNFTSDLVKQGKKNHPRVDVFGAQRGAKGIHRGCHHRNGVRFDRDHGNGVGCGSGSEFYL